MKLFNEASIKACIDQNVEKIESAVSKLASKVTKFLSQSSLLRSIHAFNKRLFSYVFSEMASTLKSIHNDPRRVKAAQDFNKTVQVADEFFKRASSKIESKLKACFKA